MDDECESRLARLGLTLPLAPMPAASYVPFARSGNLLWLAGQIPLENGEPRFIGRLGDSLTLEQGQAAARLCGLNALAQIKAAVGRLDRVNRVLRLVGYVASSPDFVDQHKVVNGASDLLSAVFGELGRHARSAVGVSALPLGVPVEVEITVELS
jgi:enamine deaminase RidA (YjgF/YER057c/UK114 family)